MIIICNQLAGLGIRNRLHRMAAWVGSNVTAAIGTFTISVAIGIVTYLALFGWTLWRLTGPR